MLIATYLSNLQKCKKILHTYVNERTLPVFRNVHDFHLSNDSHMSFYKVELNNEMCNIYTKYISF